MNRSSTGWLFILNYDLFNCTSDEQWCIRNPSFTDHGCTLVYFSTFQCTCMEQLVANWENTKGNNPAYIWQEAVGIIPINLWKIVTSKPEMHQHNAMTDGFRRNAMTDDGSTKNVLVLDHWYTCQISFTCSHVNSSSLKPTSKGRRRHT